MTGFVLPALSIGLGSISLRPSRGFYPSKDATGSTSALKADAVLEEMHRDDMEITEHPVELGASIADHAFMRPAEVVIHCAWSNSPTNTGIIGAALGVAGLQVPVVGQAVAAVKTVQAVNSLLSGDGADQAKQIYKRLLELQASRIPFDIYTGKRAYKNMLFKSLAVTTDKSTETCLAVTAVCRQVIIATTRTAKLPLNANALANPQANAPTINTGVKQLLGSTLGSGFFGVF